MQLRRLLVPFFALAFSGCAEIPTDSNAESPEISYELYDPGLRRAPETINAHVYGSFSLNFEGSGASVILSGPANFPGNPPGGPGTCDNGLWINSAGKPTRGDKVNPHPHCIANGATVVLEPISAFYTGFAGEKPTYSQLLFGHEKAALQITQWLEPTREGELARVEGLGEVVGYAIDESTLGTTNRRVGLLIVDLKHYSGSVKLFDSDCTIDGGSVPCLNQLVTAVYKPFGEGGVGVGTTTTGFLWFRSGTIPFNY